MKIINLLILFISIHFLTMLEAVSENKFKFIERNYGIFHSNAIVKDGRISEATIQHAVIDTALLIKKTNIISAKKGVEFGVEYVLQSKVKEPVRLLIEWRYPKEIPDPINGAKIRDIKYFIDIETNFVNSSNYTLEQDFEIVKGEWELIIYYENKVIYDRKFVLE